MIIGMLLINGCSNDLSEEKIREISFVSRTANLGSHKLKYSINQEGEYLVVFENGLGDFGIVWKETRNLVAQNHRAVTYDRGGYGSSELGPTPRDLVQLATELHAMKNVISPNEKIILVVSTET